MIVIIDHLDSFTFNIVHAFRRLGRDVAVRDYRQSNLEPCLAADGVILGPGPHGPDDVWESIRLTEKLVGRVPLFGICLGHQIIAAAFGGRVQRARRVVHGVPVAIHHRGRDLFTGLEDPVAFIRYHSMVVARPIPSDLYLDAWDEDGDVAALSHRQEPIWSVQFHPESIQSPDGIALFGNFIAELDGFRVSHRASTNAARAQPQPMVAQRHRS